MHIVEREDLKRSIAKLREAAEATRTVAPAISIRASALARELELKLQQRDAGLR